MTKPNEKDSIDRGEESEAHRQLAQEVSQELDRQAKLLPQLNQHPLNQAAAERLRQLREGLNPQLLHIIQLALLGLMQDSEDGDPSQEEIRLAEFNRLPQVAMSRLIREGLEPGEILQSPLDQLGEQVLSHLTPSPPRD